MRKEKSKVRNHNHNDDYEKIMSHLEQNRKVLRCVDDLIYWYFYANGCDLNHNTGALILPKEITAALDLLQVSIDDLDFVRFQIKDNLRAGGVL